MKFFALASTTGDIRNVGLEVRNVEALFGLIHRELCEVSTRASWRWT
jgi:hypothetical protein